MSTEQNRFALDQPPAIQKQALVQIRSRATQRAETDARITAYHTLRDKVASKRGKEYWRSLEELADTPEFNDYIQHEFPEQAAEFSDPVARRTFLKLMGASLALAGFSTACAYQPREIMESWIEMDEEMIPGKPLFFATAMPTTGLGLLVRSNEGRPTKIDGNPEHPISQGATDVHAQAELLRMYDPDRSQIIVERGEPSSWSRFTGELRNTWLARARERQGAGLRFLTETVISPTLGRQMAILLQEMPQARWIQFDPVGRDTARIGAFQALGQPLNTQYDFERARRVLSIDSDFLAARGISLRYARDYMRVRNTETLEGINRLYAAEVTPTQTGAKADHRIPLKPSEIEAFTRAVAAGLGIGAGANFTVPNAPQWIPALVRDLQAHRGASIVIVGDEQPPVIHALGHAMNAALGNVGQTVFFTESNEVQPSDGLADFRTLVNDMDNGQVETLIIMGGNPVYSAPADFDFRAKLEKVPFRVHHGLYNDETAEHCHFHVPESHFLEMWGDTRSADGTISIIQPIINPLYDTKSSYEFLGAFGETVKTSGYDILRETYMPALQQGGDADKKWRRIVHNGVIGDAEIPNTRFQPRTGVSVNPNIAATTTPPPPPIDGLEIVFRADPHLLDGRYANNGWLMELPQPLSKMTWDNLAIFSPKTARELDLYAKFSYKGGSNQSDIVTLRHAGYEVDAPVWILPGHPDGVVTVHLGWGRGRAGRVGDEVGFNAYRIRTSNAPYHGSGVTLEQTGSRAELASTQLHFLTEDREPVRVVTIADYVADPDHAFDGHHPVPTPDVSMYPPYNYDDGNIAAWGMAIDLNSCVGCNACVLSCQAENNIPIVGKEQIARSREMHWLRIDAYYIGSEEAGSHEGQGGDREDAASNPQGPYFQPLMCVHCELAPCEPVCPVAATVHDAEGLNVQVYNRCIGTRYCSNNCPYKVRRFNFLLYADFETEQYKMMRNPEVSVRSRGVMEKCTYCIQRIQHGKIEASKENRFIIDGEVVTACQSVCPTRAITFGNLNDPNSAVSITKRNKRNFGLLEELNTRPRTTHMGILRNPNPEIEPPVVRKEHHGAGAGREGEHHAPEANEMNREQPLQHEGGH